MLITQTFRAPNFGRAMTSKEKQDYKTLIKYTDSLLSVKNRSAIEFDFNFPSEKGFNTGIGTSFSDEAYKFNRFVKDMTNINRVQKGPQSKITPGNLSPYSGPCFALGEHLIDLKKLTKPEYGCLLDEIDIQKADNNYPGDKNLREYRTDYEYANGTDIKKGAHSKLLRKAYNNFIFARTVYDEQAERMNEELQEFKEKNKEWLEKETMFTVLSNVYGTDDYERWQDIDCGLYTDLTPPAERRNRIDTIIQNLKEHQQYLELMEYENFKQFILDKQLKESKQQLGSIGIKTDGDCLLGFSKSEVWGNKDCFKENLFYGGPDPNCLETDGIQTWGFNALDYSKLGEYDENGNIIRLGKTGKLLYNKFSKFFERYDGIRMDAAWQFVTPFLYKETFDGEFIEYEEVPAPELGSKILKIMELAKRNVSGERFDINDIMLELVGLSADKARAATLNKYPHLYTTAYAEYGESPERLKQRGYEADKFYTGAGNHDNDTLVNQSRDIIKRRMHLKGIKQDFNTELNNIGFSCAEYKNQTDEEKEQENFRNAKFAESFTAPNHFFTLPDMFGMSERINISGAASNENWRVRIPSNYEEFYHKQLASGYGLNVPKAMETALRMKRINNPKVLSKLNEAAEILRQNGPMTEKDANEAEKKGMLKSRFDLRA